MKADKSEIPISKLQTNSNDPIRKGNETKVFALIAAPLPGLGVVREWGSGGLHHRLISRHPSGMI
jgi:hypothetical protein